MQTSSKTTDKIDASAAAISVLPIKSTSPAGITVPAGNETITLRSLVRMVSCQSSRARAGITDVPQFQPVVSIVGTVIEFVKDDGVMRE